MVSTSFLLTLFRLILLSTSSSFFTLLPSPCLVFLHYTSNLPSLTPFLLPFLLSHSPILPSPFPTLLSLCLLFSPSPHPPCVTGVSETSGILSDMVKKSQQLQSLGTALDTTLSRVSGIITQLRGSHHTLLRTVSNVLDPMRIASGANYSKVSIITRGLISGGCQIL